MNYNTGGTFDVGLWQVNSFNWKVCNGGAAPCGLPQNLACAIDVWRSVESIYTQNRIDRYFLNSC